MIFRGAIRVIILIINNKINPNHNNTKAINRIREIMKNGNNINNNNNIVIINIIQVINF